MGRNAPKPPEKCFVLVWDDGVITFSSQKVVSLDFPRVSKLGRNVDGRNPGEIFENTSGLSDGSAHLSLQGSNLDLHTGQANAYAVGPGAG